MNNHDRIKNREIWIGKPQEWRTDHGLVQFGRHVDLVTDSGRRTAFVPISKEEIQKTPGDEWLQILEERTAEAITRLLLD